MAETTTLITDPSKINPAGAEESDLQEYQKSLEQQISALEQRYAQPNWFKVAAGFAKPQLGGFTASLGSAADALGENIEKQRESQLPIAQMRTQLAQSKIAMGQNQKAADIYAAHQGPVTEELVKELVRIAPDSASTKAAQAQLAAQQKRQELTSGATRDFISAIQAKVAAGIQITPEEKSALQNASKNLLNQPSPKENLPLGNPNVKPDLTSINAQVDALNKKIQTEGFTPENKQALAELNKKRNDAMQGTSSGTSASPRPAEDHSTTNVGFYPETVARPNLEGQLPVRQKQLEEEHVKNSDAVRNRYDTMLDNYFQVASEPNWSVLKTSVDGSLNLIQQHPDVSKKVFNMIRGDGELKNQIMALLNSGVGVNVGSFNGSLSIPIEAMTRAGISPADQTYADILARNMLTIGLARLQAQGVRPEKGTEAYANALTTKANLGETPISAYKALMGEQVTFDTIKGIHDVINQEKSQRRHNPNSATPIADIYLNSKEIKRIEKDALDRRTQINKDYEEWLQGQKSKRNKKG